MKYRQLTKEQFEGLHEEFARFLASQNIDKKEWDELKKEKPQVAEEEMNVFSDVVWDDVLTKTAYLEHFSSKVINLFKCEEKEIHRIVIKIDKEVNVLEQEGFEWLLKKPNDEAIEFLRGSKAYEEERNVEIFDLIEKGSNISKGELYEYFDKLTSNS
ncbi:hypothetical protein C7448_10425 [Tenacibaculum gallaicum]|uniref:Histidyl-tRNA synthetase n=1 Tax=Tenacibaculum gallaicum TaxID=561505 RepID=A0A3E0HVD4_9FLAO|nr:DUF6495 family protein [Tenacibaculum gallaicum]REH50414.1 hypothetical protein C7448_10425 [Tenacibaculum gallaicum]